MNSMTSNDLTSAGLAVGIGILLVDHIRWWRTAPGGGAAAAAAGGGGKSRDPMVLAQTWSGICFGTLMVACPAGMLGTAAGFLRWGGNGIGGTIMSTLTGAHATDVADASAPKLDGPGAIVVTALVVVLFLLRKTYAKHIRSRFLRGVFIGTVLAIGTGVFAIIGQTVVPGVNGLGAQLIGHIVHGSVSV